MNIDFKQLREDIKDDEAKKSNAFKKALGDMTERRQKEAEEINNLRLKLVQQERNEMYKEMTERQYEEAEAAKERVKAEYREKTGADWAQNEIDKALKRQVTELFKN